MYAHLYTANITVFSNIIYDIACYVLFIMILCRRAFRVKQKEKKYEINTVHTVCKQQLDAVARVAQWLEHWAQRSDDSCVGGSNPTVGHGCWSFG